MLSEPTLTAHTTLRNGVIDCDVTPSRDPECGLGLALSNTLNGTRPLERFA